MNKILVVDDDETMRMLITETLALKDYEILEATNGKSGFELIKEEKPAIVLLDLMMPKLDGYEVIKKLNEEDLMTNIKIVILTAKGKEEEKKLALERGADYFLSKPFSPMNLLELIGKIEG